MRGSGRAGSDHVTEEEGVEVCGRDRGWSGKTDGRGRRQIEKVGASSHSSHGSRSDIVRALCLLYSIESTEPAPFFR